MSENLGLKNEFKNFFVSYLLKAYFAVCLHLHHSLDNTLSILWLFSEKNFPIFIDWAIPSLLKFRWVSHLNISKFTGSPLPGATACLINTYFPPSFNKVCNLLFEFAFTEILKDKSISKKKFINFIYEYKNQKIE